MARLIHFKEAEEAGIIRKGSYVSCPFYSSKANPFEITLGVEKTGIDAEQIIRINPCIDFTFQGITPKSGITLIGSQPVAEVIIGGYEAYNHNEKGVGEFFSEYAKQLNALVDSYYSVKKNGIKAWCPQKDDMAGMSFSIRMSLDGIWLASPFVQLKSIYGLYFLDNGVARIEPLCDMQMEKWMEATHGVAVGVSLPEDAYVVVENFNSGNLSERPLMWVNLDSDNPLEVYDLEIKRLSCIMTNQKWIVEDVKKERKLMQKILDKSGKEGLLRGNWICF